MSYSDQIERQKVDIECPECKHEFRVQIEAQISKPDVEITLDVV